MSSNIPHLYNCQSSGDSSICAQIQTSAPTSANVQLDTLDNTYSLVCRTYNTAFAHLSTLLAHEKMHDPHSCSQCGKKFEKFTRLKKHERKKHGANSIDVGTMSCRYCDQAFSRPCLLARHQKIHIVNGKFACAFCSETFADWQSFNLHRSCHDGCPFICSFCDKFYFSFKTLRLHNIRYHRHRRLACVDCAVRNLHQRLASKTPQATGARGHQETSIIDCSYHCNKCTKRFFKKLSLKSHEIKCLKDERNFCNFCGRSFKRFGNLKRHVLLEHTAEVLRQGTEGTLEGTAVKFDEKSWLQPHQHLCGTELDLNQRADCDNLLIQGTPDIQINDRSVLYQCRDCTK